MIWEWRLSTGVFLTSRVWDICLFCLFRWLYSQKLARSPEVNGWHSKQATYDGTLSIPAILEAARQVPRLFMDISEDLRYPSSLPHLEAGCSVHRDAWLLPGVELAAVPWPLTPQVAKDKRSLWGVLFYYLEPGLLEGSLIWIPLGASLVSRVSEVSWSDDTGAMYMLLNLLSITWEHGLEWLRALSCALFYLFFSFSIFLWVYSL